VAIAALKHKARINGVEMPAKVTMTNSTGEDLVPIPIDRIPSALPSSHPSCGMTHREIVLN